MRLCRELQMVQFVWKYRGNIGGLGMWLGLVLREGSDLNARPRAYPFIVEWCRGRFMWGVLLLSFILTGPYWTSGYLHG